MKLGIKKILPRGLLGRSLLIIVIPLVLLQIVTGIIFYDRHWSTVSRHRALALAGEISLVTLLRSQAEPRFSETELAYLAAITVRLEFEVLSEGPVIDGTFEPQGNLQKTLAKALDGPFRNAYIIDTESQPDRVIVWLKINNEIIRVTTDSERLISSTTSIFIYWMVGTSIILFAVATLFMRNQVRPLRRLARAAESFGKGHIETAFEPSGATEVRQAATAFLAMRERIIRQVQQRTLMLAGVSHDLRTPLTRMKLQLAMLPKDADAADMQNDVTEMENMISGYLDFVRGDGDEKTQAIRIDELILEVAKDARINENEIETGDLDESEITVRRDAFKRCLTNLVTNGLRYGAEKVRISATDIGGHLAITIDDDGPGIPEALREDVFRPFYRIDASRNTDTGGTGLGLSIAQEIVHAHGGKITLNDSPMGGLRAEILLPI